MSANWRKDRAVELRYEEGFSVEEISTILRIDQSTIYRWLDTKKQELKNPKSLPDKTKGKYPTEVKYEVIKYFLHNYTIKEISRLFEINRRTISRWLDEFNIRKKRERKKGYPQDTVDRAVALYQSGHTKQEVAAEIGCSPSSISRWLKEQGIKARPGNSSLTKREINKIISLYTSTELTVKEVASKLGKSQETVSKYLHQNGIGIDRRRGKQKYLGKFVCPSCNNELDIDEKHRTSALCKDCYNDPKVLLRYSNKAHTQIYNVLAENQNYKCAICGKDEEENGGKLFIDHNHETGKIRGLLCRKCNWGLGHFEDSKENLKKASDYLDSPPAKLRKVFLSRLDKRKRVKKKRIHSRRRRV